MHSLSSINDRLYAHQKKPQRAGRLVSAAPPSTAKPYKSYTLEEPDNIAELSRLDVNDAWVASDLDMFDLGSNEAQMLEAGTSPSKDALAQRTGEPNHFFEAHDVEYLAELEQRMDHMNEGDHPNKKTRSALRLADPSKLGEQAELFRKFPPQEGNLEMHFTYGQGRDRKPIPSRFDWRQRATSQTPKRYNKEIKQRFMPTLAQGEKKDRWRDAIAGYSEK